MWHPGKFKKHNASQSHTSYLKELLLFAKQDIPSGTNLNDYKVLMSHAQKCSNGRIQYLNECISETEADEGHAVEIQKMKEICWEMRKSVSRLEDTLIEKESEEDKMYKFERSKERPEEKEERKKRRQHHEYVMEWYREIRGIFAASNEERVAEILTQVASMGKIFADNFCSETTGKVMEETSLIYFRNIRSIAFTLWEIQDVITYCKLHSEIFGVFLVSTSIIKTNEKALGLDITSCIKMLKKISERTSLFEILRCPVLLHLFDPSDEELDNMDN